MNNKRVLFLFAAIHLMVYLHLMITKYLTTQKLNFTQMIATEVFRQTTWTQIVAIEAESPKIALVEVGRSEITAAIEIPAKTRTESSQIRATVVPVQTRNENSSSAGETCPKRMILYTRDGGNTGNKVWEYLSVLAVYKLFPEKRFLPYLPDSMINHLKEFFEPLSLPVVSTLPVKCQNFTGGKIIHIHEMYPVIAKLPNDTKIVQLATFSARHEDVIRFGLDKVRQEFRFKPASVKIAMDTLYELKRHFSIPSEVNPVYVGVQFRGGGYTTYLRKWFNKKYRGPPTHEFYSRAMKYFTDKYEHVIFILISIDYKWVKKNAPRLKGNVAVNPYRYDKLKDMALLSHCNHSIINYGTFGTTVAMLAGGTTIVYDLKVDLDHDGRTIAMAFTKIVDNWILMD